MRSPKISIIIPSYNRKTVLKRALDSVLAQKWKDFELIVIDDGSTDGTDQFVDEYFCQNKLDPFFFKYLFTKNAGVSAARNRGASLARGEYLAFLDSDDEWLPKKLLWQMELAEKKPHLSIIHGEEIWIRKGVRVNQMKKHQKFGGFIFEKCLGLCLISPSAVVLKRDLYMKQGGFREDFPVCEDYDLWLKITAHEEVGFLKEAVIYKYGGHDDQLSHSMKAMDYYRVLALDDIFQKGSLNSIQAKSVVEMILKKSKILIDGYQRHNKLSDCSYIQKIFEKYQDKADT